MAAAEHHVSGLYVTMLIENLGAELSEEAIRGVLAPSRRDPQPRGSQRLLVVVLL